ncbi:MULTISPECIES: IS4 family transposase [unclassified Moraxella]|uniref:IS4 family transposase n=1 Tax=unclassified Moraxella TaxID=2685852 RepID=UPI003AF8A3D3
MARHIPKAGKTDSHYRRLQRFIAEASIDYDQLAVMIYRLFKLGKVTLTIDRTNWKWGKANINIFMLGVVYRGIAIPLYWEMLDKRGNTSQLERKDIIQRFISRFGKDNINSILADREFVGTTWFNWLNDNNIPFVIRIKKSSKVSNHHGKQVQIKTLFRHVTSKETYRHGRILTVDGCLVRVFAKRDKEHGLVIVATNQLDTLDAMSQYAKRWEIETLFACLKGRGFNLEDTHLTHLERVSRLVAVNALAFCWAYHIGVHKDKDKPLKRKIKSNGRPQASLFGLGLDLLIEGLRLVFYTNDTAVFRQLVSFLTPKPLKVAWG